MKFRVIANGCNFAAGERLRLTAEQIARRGHAVSAIDDRGLVEAKLPIQFKVGEVIDLPSVKKSEDISSYLATVLEPVAKSADKKTGADDAAIKAAVAAVEAAKARADAAQTDDEKAFAQAEIDAAEAALAKLKG